jgi:uncharacterized membrane protein
MVEFLTNVETAANAAKIITPIVYFLAFVIIKIAHLDNRSLVPKRHPIELSSLQWLLLLVAIGFGVFLFALFYLLFWEKFTLSVYPWLSTLNLEILYSEHFDWIVGISAAVFFHVALLFVKLFKKK